MTAKVIATEKQEYEAMPKRSHQLRHLWHRLLPRHSHRSHGHIPWGMVLVVGAIIAIVVTAIIIS